MAVVAIDAHDLYGVKINTTVIGGITQQRLPTGMQLGGELADGAVYPRIQSVRSERVTAEFTSLAIAAALDEVGLVGAAITGAGVSLYGHKRAPGGTRAGTLSHKEYNIKAGIIVPRTISAEHQTDALIAYEVMASYDGTNNPVVLIEGVTLPADPNDATRFSLGKTTIGGVVLTSLRSVEIDIGITVASEGGDSDVWDTHVSITSIRPIIRLRGIDLQWFKDTGGLGLLGLAATHANTIFYLRKRLQGGSFVADGTPEHIKFTAHGLAYIEEAFDGQSNQTGEVTLTIETNFDGTNAPLIVNTASAIT